MHSIQGWGPIVNRQHILAAQVAKTYDLLAHDNLWKKRLPSMQVKVVDWLRVCYAILLNWLQNITMFLGKVLYVILTL